MLGFFRRARDDESGAILAEFAIAIVILTLFFFMAVEMVWLYRDGIYLQRIARDAARETVITKSFDAGYAVASDRARAYFGKYAGDVTVNIEEKTLWNMNKSIVCTVKYPHRFFGWYSKKLLGGTGVTLSAKAVFVNK